MPGCKWSIRYPKHTPKPHSKPRAKWVECRMVNSGSLRFTGLGFLGAEFGSGCESRVHGVGLSAADPKPYGKDLSLKATAVPGTIGAGGTMWRRHSGEDTKSSGSFSLFRRPAGL